MALKCAAYITETCWFTTLNLQAVKQLFKSALHMKKVMKKLFQYNEFSLKCLTLPS